MGTIFDAYLKSCNKWGVYVNNSVFLLENDNEIEKALQALKHFLVKEYGPTLSEDYYSRLFFDSILYITFDSEKEARRFYRVLDREECYSYAIYASLHCPEHGCITENT